MPRWLTCFLPLLLISLLTFSQGSRETFSPRCGSVPVTSSRSQLSAERSSAPHRNCSAQHPPLKSRGIPGNYSPLYPE